MRRSCAVRVSVSASEGRVEGCKVGASATASSHHDAVPKSASRRYCCAARRTVRVAVNASSIVFAYHAGGPFTEVGRDAEPVELDGEFTGAVGQRLGRHLEPERVFALAEVDGLGCPPDAGVGVAEPDAVVGLDEFPHDVDVGALGAGATRARVGSLPAWWVRTYAMPARLRACPVYRVNRRSVSASFSSPTIVDARVSTNTSSAPSSTAASTSSRATGRSVERVECRQQRVMQVRGVESREPHISESFVDVGRCHLGVEDEDVDRILCGPEQDRRALRQDTRRDTGERDSSSSSVSRTTSRRGVRG